MKLVSPHGRQFRNLWCQAWKSWRLHKFVMIYNQSLFMANWTFWILFQSIWTKKKSHIKIERISSPSVACSEIDIVFFFLFSSVRLRNWVGPLHQLKEAASNKVTGIVVLLRQRQPKWLSIITASIPNNKIHIVAHNHPLGQKQSIFIGVIK